MNKLFRERNVNFGHRSRANTVKVNKRSLNNRKSNMGIPISYEEAIAGEGFVDDEEDEYEEYEDDDEEDGDEEEEDDIDIE
jgi:hypothetical protein